MMWAHCPPPGLRLRAHLDCGSWAAGEPGRCQVIDMQLLGGVLLALAVLVGAVIVLSVAMLAAAAVARPGQAPPGGIRRGLPEHPQPDPGEARELVLR